jgi:hypothetical protein
VSTLVDLHLLILLNHLIYAPSVLLMFLFSIIEFSRRYKIVEAATTFSNSNKYEK